MTLPDLVAQADARASATAVVTASRRVARSDLLAEADRWSGEVARAVPAGEAVAVRLQDPVTFIAAALGTWLAGCPLVPVGPERRPAEIADVMRESGARLLVTDLERAELSAPEHVRVVRRAAAGAGRSRPRAPEDPALLLYTSGSTGAAKCVVFSHLAMVRNVRALIEAAELDAADRLMTPLAPALTTAMATCVLPALALGAPMVLPGRFLPLQTVGMLRDEEVTFFLGVPYVYHLLAELPRERLALPALRLLVTNSAPMPAAVAEAVEGRLGLLPRSNYCSSEAGGITYNRAGDRRLLLESVGTALPGVRVRVVDAEDRPLAAGEEGRIVVESDMLASGYLGRPDLTAEVFRAPGCAWTDDLGVVDADGYVRVTGRMSDIVNIAGHLVNPAQVEAVLAEHPAVAEALVQVESDPRAGQRLSALVVLAGHVDPAGLRDYCFDRLAGHSVPRRIEIVSSLPRTELGKVRRTRPAP